MHEGRLYSACRSADKRSKRAPVSPGHARSGLRVTRRSCERRAWRRMQWRACDATQVHRSCRPMGARGARGRCVRAEGLGEGGDHCHSCHSNDLRPTPVPHPYPPPSRPPRLTRSTAAGRAVRDRSGPVPRQPRVLLEPELHSRLPDGLRTTPRRFGRLRISSGRLRAPLHGLSIGAQFLRPDHTQSCICALSRNRNARNRPPTIRMTSTMTGNNPKGLSGGSSSSCPPGVGDRDFDGSSSTEEEP